MTVASSLIKNRDNTVFNFMQIRKSDVAHVVSLIHHVLIKSKIELRSHLFKGNKV